MGIVIQIIAAVLVFGLLIFVHELGHFTVGKLSGMRVNEFSIGMGPALWSRSRGETAYSLRLLPIGGYVAVEGEDSTSDDPRAFSNVKLWKRFLFVGAGALMNLLLGFVLFAILVGMRETLQTTVVANIHAQPSAGVMLEAGDEIVRVNGSRVFTSNDIVFSMVSDRDGVVDFTVERGGQRVELSGVAFRMGEREDGTRVIDPGFSIATEANSLWGGARYTFLWMISVVRQVWFSFVNLITGNFALSELSGPVGVSSVIGQAVGQTKSLGIGPLLMLVGFITVNMGVFNLLPIPALDGGRLLFLLIELVMRRPVAAKYEGWVHAAGFIALMGLMVAVTFNDIIRLF